jgi:hypothetical protein
MEEANLEPKVHMDPARYKRLEELLIERATSLRTDLRAGEREIARLYLDAMALAREEAVSGVPMTDSLLIGRQVPADQTPKDESNAKLNK